MVKPHLTFLRHGGQTRSEGIWVMGRLRTLVVAGAALAISGASVLAADMPGSRPPPLPPPQYRAPLLELDCGWYLRGDLGGFWGRVDGAEMHGAARQPDQQQHGQRLHRRFRFRLEVALAAHRRHDRLRDADQIQGHRSRAPTTPPPRSSRPPRFSTAMLDLGTWYHIAAYIGGGAGVAYNRITDFATAVPVTGDFGQEFNGISPMPAWRASPFPFRTT